MFLVSSLGLIIMVLFLCLVIMVFGQKVMIFRLIVIVIVYTYNLKVI